MSNIIKKSILALFVLCAVSLFGQNTKRVLFLGNSYTYVNNLPQMVSDMAASTGKTLIFDSNTPGGYYLGQHLTNPESLAKIKAGNWDNVVLQDQSMALAYPDRYKNFIATGIALDSIIKANNLCSQTMFYSTWGRKNGDTYLCTPPQCAQDTWINRTYYEMDSDIEVNYKTIADSLKSSMAPVGAVWRYIRQQYPTIELFQEDESHPSLAGSYAAACCFYAAIFRSDPTQITFNSGLSVTDAANIRQAAKQIVYNHLPEWNVGPYDDLLNENCMVLGVDSNITEHWTVYPNPVTDVLCVRFPENSVDDIISVYNVLGDLIKEVEAQETTYIDFSGLSNGLYIIRSANSQRIFKVVKK
ncbi:T9SS type A sorting domain-containing protein [Flavobacterium cerinum]|uniref:T9SS type A sorting domain-containing protein n=1 Tax=Flavobacterium cerinum TaxID=2502784 RepID=A0A3S3QFP0_9FLAO|nr:T9SS type A sorting domain-containing protein [Flavobacterium cerinum]RWW92373.1 T9SS type A sorting domain-containing protein [Flavobacterium cerinum]